MQPEAALLPLLVHIQTHLDDDLSLESLATQTERSPFELHRAFKAAMGETPRQHIERLRLERAAFHLLVRQATILDVALDCGFDSHEVFTRAFKRRFGSTPKEYRESRRRMRVAAAGRKAGLEEKLPTGTLSSTKIHEMAPLTVAFIRHLGPYEDVPLSVFDRLTDFLRQRRLPLDSPLLGIGHDSPAQTPASRLRFDACAVVPPETKPVRGIGMQELDERTAAVTTYIGPFSGLPAAYRSVFQSLMARKDVELIGIPIIERYRRTEGVLGGSMQQTEICVPVRRLV